MGYSDFNSLREVVPPTEEPVTLTEAKEWCRVSGTDQDNVLNMLITAMRKYAERYTGRAFPKRTYELRRNGFPPWEYCLPWPPLIQVDLIEYVDISSATVQYAGSPTPYRVDAYAVPGRIMPFYGESWPIALVDYDSVRITYQAGYVNAAAMPPELKQWIEARISTLYENREQIITGTIVAELPHSFMDGALDGLVVGERMF